MYDHTVFVCCASVVQADYLPTFTVDEKALLKKSYDYMGLTIYTAKYAAQVPDNPNGWWVKTNHPETGK